MIWYVIERSFLYSIAACFYMWAYQWNCFKIRGKQRVKVKVYTTSFESYWLLTLETNLGDGRSWQNWSRPVHIMWQSDTLLLPWWVAYGGQEHTTRKEMCIELPEQGSEIIMSALTSSYWLVIQARKRDLDQIQLIDLDPKVLILIYPQNDSKPALITILYLE